MTDISKLSLTMTTSVWSRIMNSRNAAKTEIGFLGICEDPERPLHITDLYMPKQLCNSVHMDFDENDIAEHMMDMAELNILPSQCMRIWIHTHPGPSCEPSGEDRTTFESFIQGEWAVMAIVGTTNNLYAELGLNHPLGKFNKKIDWIIDWSADAKETNIDHWLQEMEQKVEVETFKPKKSIPTNTGGNTGTKATTEDTDTTTHTTTPTATTWVQYLEAQTDEVKQELQKLTKTSNKLVERNKPVPWQLREKKRILNRLDDLKKGVFIDVILSDARRLNMDRVEQLCMMWKDYHEFVQDLLEAEAEAALAEAQEIQAEEDCEIEQLQELIHDDE